MPEWSGSRVLLRPVRQSDYEWLYSLCQDPAIAVRWRFRGAIPEPADFASSMTAGVLVQFMVLQRDTKDQLGLVAAYNPNLRDSWVYAAALASPRAAKTGLVLEGLGLLIRYVFQVWPFRKIYFETIEYNLDQFKTFLRYLSMRRD
ncbi:MAG: GNAT family N-acetyltransferase [Acidimicrobiales bacterium]